MTDERVEPGATEITNVVKHIARYNHALAYAKGYTLDAACGTGYGTFLLSQVVSYATGIDIDEETIKKAKKNYKKYASDNIDFIVNDLSTIYKQEKYDTIVSFETIEHLSDTHNFKQFVYKSLKKGGLFIYSVPLFEKPQENPYHKSVYTVETARAIMADLPFIKEYYQAGINFYDKVQNILPQYYFGVKINL